MKACLLTIFLLVFATIAKTQDLDDEISFEMSFDSSLVGSNLCETAKNMAKRDIELGRFATTVSKKQFSKTFQRLMLKKFNVHVFTNGTCLENEFMNCYRDITFPIIKEKFGDNILQETFNEAIELDNLNGKL
jgi:serine kinase of HPr protein (carbohydrate metabolism regulator)